MTEELEKAVAGRLSEERSERVVALVPAHNEEALIADTVSSLLSQTSPPERVIVVADNCTDRTPQIAEQAGAEVFFTRENRHKKAGGLNQALAEVLPELPESGFVLVMDGDSRLAPGFIEAALDRMEPGVGAAGGIFLAARTSNLVEYLQHNEYVRYSREIARSGKQAKVITGTGSLFRAAALAQVAEARGAGKLPGGHAQVYDTQALTEDNELTLALKTLGWRCVSPKECVVMTDVMPSWGKLWTQRVRWQRGAFENLKAYGLTRTTAPYIGKQAFMGLGTFAISMLLLLTLLAAFTGSLSFQPFWMALGGVFFVERVVTAFRGGKVSVAIASVLAIEFAYDLLQQAIYVKCLTDSMFGRSASWGGNHAGVERAI